MEGTSRMKLQPMKIKAIVQTMKRIQRDQKANAVSWLWGSAVWAEPERVAEWVWDLGPVPAKILEEDLELVPMPGKMRFLKIPYWTLERSAMDSFAMGRLEPAKLPLELKALEKMLELPPQLELW